MRKKVFISFVEDTIKVIYANQSGGRIAIESSFTLTDGTLDAFLKKERISNPIIIYHFKRFYTDIFSAPPANKKYLNQIVGAEIAKRYPDLKEFSFFHQILQKKPGDERPSQDIFFFAVNNEDLDSIIERFMSQDISVQAIYADIPIMSCFVLSSDAYAAKSNLFLYATENDKNLFLIKDNHLQFIRNTPSFGEEINVVDTDNINMTINYVRQNFKTNPEQIVLVNSALPEGETPLETIIPVSVMDHGASFDAPPKTLREFIVPAAAALVEKKIPSLALMPAAYKNFLIQKRALTSAIACFVVISVIALAYIAVSMVAISETNARIAASRKSLQDIPQVITAYESAVAQLQPYEPLVHAVNEARSGPNIRQILGALTFLPMQDISIQQLNIDNKSDAFKMTLSGNVAAQTYAQRYKITQELLKRIARTPRLAVAEHNLDLKEGKFQITIQLK